MMRLLSRSSVFMLGLILIEMGFVPCLTLAQIVPDQTLGNETSVLQPNVRLNGETLDLITGGAVRSTNLFHSFEQFNVGESQRVYFDSPSSIQSILTRVTGNDVSDIMGTLGVTGGADLFLVNPNGIIFGASSRLDVGGSFVATTADEVQFDTLGMFSSRNPVSPSSLLTIAPSAFLFGSEPAGAIVNQSAIATTYSDEPEEVIGLRVPNGEALGFLGGDVLVDGGGLSALGGRIEIVSMIGEGQVDIDENLRFQISDDVLLGDVRFQNDAVVDTAWGGGGDIRVFGNTIDIVSSVLQAGIRAGQDVPGKRAGTVLLIGAERIRMRGVSELAQSHNRLNSGVSNSIEQNSIGEAGAITIVTPLLRIAGGAQFNASIFGQGDTGLISISASDRIIIDGTSENQDFMSGIFTLTDMRGRGDPGKIRITTPILRVRNGAQISSSVMGKGNGQTITVNATDLLTLDGASDDKENASGIFSTLNGSGVGRAGRIQINTAILNIRNGARINSSTSGQGDGGRVRISATNHLNLEGMAQDDDPDSFSRIASEAFSNSASQSSDSNSNDTLSLQSRAADAGEIVGNAGTIEIVTPALNVSDGAQIASSSHSAGDGGNIVINAANRIRLNRGRVHASSLGDASGQAGEITITANTASVDNLSQLLATTEEGTGGDIVLELGNLFLFGGSSITASAGKAGSGGDGGNIAIDADFIVTLSEQDSDVTANAYNGSGGSIAIEAENLFNISFQDQEQTPRNDITVSSVFGLDGEVIINSPNVDPSRGIAALPINLITPPPIATICHSQNDDRSKFVVLGRGGLPTDPTDMLNIDTVAIPWVRRDSSNLQTPVNVIDSSSDLPRPVEAEDWITDDHGRVMLISSSHQQSSFSRTPESGLCSV